MLGVHVQTHIHSVQSFAYQPPPCVVVVWLVKAEMAQVHAFCKLSRQFMAAIADAGTLICIVMR